MPFRIPRLCFVLLVACLLLTAVTHQHLSGQNAPDTPRTDSQLPHRISDQTYRVSVDLVNVLCSVFDRNTNSFVTNLTRDDFICL